MACFIVPAAEAVVTTIAAKAVRSKENEAHSSGEASVKLSSKLGILNKMLWGGSALLAFEHVWHGEVVPWFPFLTGAATSADTAEMLHEMSTVGVGMSVAVTAVWAAMSAVVSVINKRPDAAEAEESTT